MITPDTAIDLDSGDTEPLLGRWNRLRGNRAFAAATVICIGLWDEFAGPGWDGHNRVRAGDLRAFEFALATEIARRYCTGTGEDAVIAGILDGELELVIAQVSGSLQRDAEALAGTVRTEGDDFEPAHEESGLDYGPRTAADLFAQHYRDEVSIMSCCPVIVGERRLRRWMDEGIYTARTAEIDSPKWIEAVARTHAVRTFLLTDHPSAAS